MTPPVRAAQNGLPAAYYARHDRTAAEAISIFTERPVPALPCNMSPRLFSKSLCHIRSVRFFSRRTFASSGPFAPYGAFLPGLFPQICRTATAGVPSPGTAEPSCSAPLSTAAGIAVKTKTQPAGTQRKGCSPQRQPFFLSRHNRVQAIPFFAKLALPYVPPQPAHSRTAQHTGFPKQPTRPPNSIRKQSYACQPSPAFKSKLLSISRHSRNLRPLPRKVPANLP